MNCKCNCHLKGKPFCSECWDQHEHDDDEYNNLILIPKLNSVKKISVQHKTMLVFDYTLYELARPIHFVN